MNRFRAADKVSSSAPISECAQSIKIPAGDLEKEGKAEETQEYADMPTVHLEDEQFEWGEVIRGKMFS